MPVLIRHCSSWDLQNPGTTTLLNNDDCLKFNDASCTHEELGVFVASWLKVSDKWYCSQCLHMTSDESKRIKLQNKQQSHLWKSCEACASCTIVTHQPNMSLVRPDYAMGRFARLSNGPLEPIQYSICRIHSRNKHLQQCYVSSNCRQETFGTNSQRHHTIFQYHPQMHQCTIT